MSIFNFKSGEARKARQKDLDRRYKTAQEGFIREQARAYVIKWHRNFCLLDRFCTTETTYKDPDHDFLLARFIEDCEIFQIDHFNEEQPLSAVLENLEQKLTNWILALSLKTGGYKDDVGSAISFLARNGRLCDVINYLDVMEKELSYHESR